ncbi:MAG: hypothetical protein CVU38_04690 [Chloroflexi bacterium HGW-Chloroflexi-1]|nr:MAG: hypothetical protein CVU38_04690 [Chloroflexi bacterium HGW-Chloroflexi-1]
MAIVVAFIKTYAAWVYGACALVALWYLRVALLARRERRYAVFALERETALNRVYGAWTAAIALIVIMGLVYFLSTVVFQAVAPLVDQTPQPLTPQVAVNGLPSATPTLPLPEITPETETPTPRPRPTRPPVPTLIPLTPTPAVQAPRCLDPRAVITSPGLNAQVSGMVPIIGTAVRERFQYYKLEYGPGTSPTDNQWSYFADSDKPVQGGLLGTFNAGTLPPGTYSIRVMVVDVTGNYVDPPCQTVVVIR